LTGVKTEGRLLFRPVVTPPWRLSGVIIVARSLLPWEGSKRPIRAFFCDFSRFRRATPFAAAPRRPRRPGIRRRNGCRRRGDAPRVGANTRRACCDPDRETA